MVVSNLDPEPSQLGRNDVDAGDPQRRAIESARRAQAEREAVLRHTRTVVAVVDIGGAVRWMSDNVEDLTGHPASHYVGGSEYNVHPDDLERIVSAYAEVLREPDGEVETLLRLAHRDGGWRWCEVYLTNQTEDPYVGGLVVSFHDVSEQRAAAEAAAFRADLLASVGQAVVASDARMRITYVNDAAAVVCGLAPEVVVGRDVTEVFPFDGMEEAIAEITQVVGSGRTWQRELWYHTADGGRVPMIVTNTPIIEHGRVTGLISVATDITEKVRTRRRLEARARMQTEVARLSKLALDSEGVGPVMTAVAESIGRTLELELATVVEVVGAVPVVRATWGELHQGEVGDLLGPRDLDPSALGLAPGRPVVIEDVAADDRFAAFLDDDGPPARSGVVALAAAPAQTFGSVSGFSTRPRPFDEDEVAFVQSLANLVASAAEREVAKGELAELNLHDQLTGLPNRVLFRDRLDRDLGRMERDGGAIGVIEMDLDHFKEVNDGFGRETGDRVLVEVAHRLEGALGADDTLARSGGDEFVVGRLAPGGTDEVLALAAAMTEALAEPIRVEDLELFVRASVGVSVHDGRVAPDTLLREADAAMYRAKGSGRGRLEVYDEHMREQAVRRLLTATDLRHAIERDELTVLWQPEIALAGDGPGELWAEALVRWQHPTRGLVNPAEFIPLAEDTGLVVPLGERVLHQACAQLATWRREAGPTMPRRASVNLSARQLASDGLVDVLADVLATNALDPAALVLEITESAVMVNPDDAIRRLHDLRALGVALALDDFGTGFSSLSYLRRLPVSILKVDKSFVDRVVSDDHDRAIVRGIVELAHALDLEVVAEGVEDEHQRDVLAALGCDRGQGYLWSRPVPAADLPATVSRL